jgi:hypothetical protein
VPLLFFDCESIASLSNGAAVARIASGHHSQSVMTASEPRKFYQFKLLGLNELAWDSTDGHAISLRASHETQVLALSGNEKKIAFCNSKQIASF